MVIVNLLTFWLQFGWQVRLEDKAVIRNGIVCLNSKVLTLLGGLVQPLYEEWQMNQKYSGFSRSSLRLSQESDTGGPPPFEKLQIEAPSHRFVPRGRSFGQFSKHFFFI
jgi:tudor domain-containing protein 3